MTMVNFNKKSTSLPSSTGTIHPAVIAPPIDKPITCHWINPSNSRYYDAWLSCDLLGHWCLKRRWGSLRRRGGTCRLWPCDSFTEALILLQHVAKKRQINGYFPVTNNRY